MGVGGQTETRGEREGDALPGGAAGSRVGLDGDPEQVSPCWSGAGVGVQDRDGVLAAAGRGSSGTARLAAVVDGGSVQQRMEGVSRPLRSLLVPTLGPLVRCPRRAAAGRTPQSERCEQGVVRLSSRVLVVATAPGASRISLRRMRASCPSGGWQMTRIESSSDVLWSRTTSRARFALTCRRGHRVDGLLQNPSPWSARAMSTSGDGRAAASCRHMCEDVVAGECPGKGGSGAADRPAASNLGSVSEATFVRPTGLGLKGT